MAYDENNTPKTGGNEPKPGTWQSLGELARRIVEGASK